MLLSVVAFAEKFQNIHTDFGEFNLVLVEKDKKLLHVLKITPSGAESLKSFTVMTGKVNGDKVVQGDEKTPEGLYFVKGFLSPAKLKGMYGEIGLQYGTGAYPLSYPNLKDRLDKKTGGGIWLHGINPERHETSTRGCVAFENDKLTMLGDYIKKGTPVLITREANLLKPEDIKKEIKGYISSWRDGDFESFKNFYHTGFKSVGGRNFASYLGFKKNLMDIFPYRVIETSNFQTFQESDDKAVAQFDQYYCADNVSSYGKKRFYMERELDSMKIIAEEFIPMDSSGYIREQMHNFLIGWKKAWESLDVESYIAFYSDNFKTRGLDKAAWRADKNEKFGKLKEVKVSIENIRFSAKTPTRYEISFRQIYRGDSYSDRGVKTIRVSGCPGDFKITSEQWRAE